MYKLNANARFYKQSKIQNCIEILYCYTHFHYTVVHEYKAKFFKALNGILYRVKGFSNDIVIKQLIQSYCKPLLLYECQCFNMTRSEISQLCKAWRCVYWQVFKVSTAEAIELIQVNTG